MKLGRLEVRILINTILFLIISTAAWAASPTIFYSDLTAGPNTGGQNNNGVFVTIWGNNFGSAQGSSTITVGGGKVANYPTWTNTMICFQLGASAATGNIVVNTPSGSSNGLAFTVQSGNIYFVQPGASTNGSGTFTSPFNHLYYAEQITNPGDAVYVLAGTIYDEEDGHPNWHTLLMPERAGTQGSPVSWIAYPNATVILQADGGTASWTDGASGGGDNVSYIFRGYVDWQTFSKFTLQMTGTGGISIIDSTGQNGWKIVGTNQTASAYNYCITCLAGNYSSVLGNEIHDSGAGQSFNNEDHSIYWDGGGSNVEIGWNYLHGNKNSGWEISCFHQGTRVGTIHDNTIVAASAGSVKGILLGDVDSGEDQTTVEAQVIKVYNNVLNNLGQFQNGGAIQAVSGTAYIYNNTIYSSGTENDGTIQFPSGGIGPGGGHPVWYVANNIIYNLVSGSLYLSDGGGSAPTWSNFALMSNNSYYGQGNGPSQDPKPVNANPQFVSNGTNFQLQSTSPDINAGYNTLAIVSLDLNGLIRDSSPSIGAYEYTGASALPSSPVVTITSPSSGISITAGSNVTITTTASETNGTISKISLYNGAGVLLGSSSSSPYNYVMTNPTTGIYTFTAVATDTNGASTTSSPITITAIALPILPSSPVVNITSPGSGSSYKAGSNVTITTTASETNGTIKNISLYNGSGILLGSSSSSTYNYVYTGILAGSYIFYAIATDANGVSTTSSTVKITVTSPATPVVTITNPVNASTYIAGSNVTITTTASETNGTIKNISLYNQAGLLVGSSSTSPYNYVFSNMPAGSYIFYAIATDTNSVSTTSSPIIITVNASIAPVVAITSPVNGSTFAKSSTITVTAAASETGGTIAQVSFYNGTSLLATDSTAPYTYTWNVGHHTSSYNLTAVATDANGVSVSSSPVIITLATLSPPVVAITNPVSGSTYTAGADLTITTTASETNGTIKNIALYNQAGLLVGSSSTSPYNYVFSNMPAGSYIFYAVATDINGVSTTSSPITMTVTGTSTPIVPPPSTAPVVSITSPASGSTYTAGANVTITTSASETNGTIKNISLYNQAGLLVGSSSTSPYNYAFTNIPVGSYIFYAIATDANGLSTTSYTLTMSVN